MTHTILKACGSYLPEKIMTNQDIEKIVADTNSEWIESRTGILKRHLVIDGENTSDLAIQAAKAALKSGNISVDELDFIIVATTSADLSIPATAMRVQNALGMKHGAGFDIQAVCSGFIYATSVADSMIKSGMAKTILVIGADTMSRLVDWSDRSTCVLFGDGAGAIVLGASDDKTGIIDSKLYSDGSLESILYTNGGVSTGCAGHLFMQGREVYRYAVESLSDSISKMADANNISLDEIDFFVTHQANMRIIEAIAKKLGQKIEKFATIVSDHANTSAASIPLALDHYLKNGKIKPGDKIILAGVGAGLTWGVILLEF